MTIYVVTGTRHPSDDLAVLARRFVFTELHHETDCLVEGEAIGIDTICGDAADECGIKHIRMGVEKVFGKNAWQRYGKGVGHRRNEKMVDTAIADSIGEEVRVVGFWNGYSKGTLGCLEYAEKRGVLWRIYFDNGMVWRAPQGDGYLPEHAWSWRVYGAFMANEMYRPSRIALAHQRMVERIEDKVLDPEKRQEWINAALAGYMFLMEGKRPIRNGAHMEFPSRSKKGEGHNVYAKTCNCKAAQFKQPCWARAAADLLETLETPPESDPLAEVLYATA